MLTIVVLGQDHDTAATSCFHVYSSCQSCYDKFSCKACQSKEFNNQIDEFNNQWDQFICHQDKFNSNGTNSIVKRPNSISEPVKWLD